MQSNAKQSTMDDHKHALELVASDEPFYALIIAAMLQADPVNLQRLKKAFPATFKELETYYCLLL